MKKKRASANNQNRSSTSKELVIGKKDKQQLNKQQQTFNRLVKKLEKLRKELEKTSQILSEKLDFYGKHIHPLEQSMAELRKEILKNLFRFYKNEKRLSKKDREVLLEIMSVQLNGIFQFTSEPPDDEIKEIFAAVEGIGYDKAVEEDFEAMKDDMEETFQKMGFEVDLDDFHKDLSQEEMMRKMAEMLENLQEQAEAKDTTRPKRKKTKKQIEKEEREKQIEEAKSKNIAGIYKQLARIFHPDLEQDPIQKSHKEDLMKQLTSAYEAGDLHALLRLELEWIHKEEGNLDKLSDEKLAIYNQTLKEQVQELEAEVFMIGQHPRYMPLQRYSFSPFGLKYVDLEREKRNLETTIEQAKQDIAELSGKNAFEKLKEIIGIFKKQQQRVNLFELDLEKIFGR